LAAVSRAPREIPNGALRAMLSGATLTFCTRVGEGARAMEPKALRAHADLQTEARRV
jgi:hypothetical protein